MADDNTGKKPDYRVYTVVRRKGKDDEDRSNDFWLSLGVGYVHGDKQGMNLLLQALPIDGRLVIRKYEEKPKEEPQGL